MKLIALDSSGLVASVAVLEDETLLAEYTICYKKTHSQTLLPMLDEITKNIELDMQSVDAIAVSAGPGSFTGLRIGSATAKGLGLALHKPLVAVPTLEAMAYNLVGAGGLICPIMDARRQQVYTGVYRFEEQRLLTVKEQQAMDIHKLLEELALYGQKVTFLGDGVPVYKEVICKELACPFAFAPVHMNKQRAGSVGALGMQYYIEGKVQTAAEHRPEYLRLSQAERERAERQKQAGKE